MNLLDYFILPCKSIVNAYSNGGVFTPYYLDFIEFPSRSPGIPILSGSLVANTYREILSVPGSGFINCLVVSTLNGTLRKVGLKLEIGGVTVFDSLSPDIEVPYVGIVAVGFLIQPAANHYMLGCQHITYTSGFKVSVKSSLSETNMIVCHIGYAKA